MLEQIEAAERRLAELDQMVADPNLHQDRKRAADVLREHARVSATVAAGKRVRELRERMDEARQMAEETDEDLREMAREELATLEAELPGAESELKVLLVPPDPLDHKNTIMEIRAGTGGDEAALFASDLYRMYSRYAETKGWKTELIDINETEIGGFKEAIFSVAGDHVFSALKFESGVHRVQRVPSTESGGRIHTSAVTVAVLPEAEETDVEVRNEDIRVDVFRSSGPGGQSVNTTDSAVRITHLPTGLVVSCQDEKSQHKNKAKALRVLKARLFEQEERKRQSEMAEARRSQVGSGDRSERIRTYNFPQSRLTDHRIGLTLYKLEAILQGDLDELIDALRVHRTEQSLAGNAS